LPLTRAKQEARVFLASVKSNDAPAVRSVKLTFSEIAKKAIPELTAGRTRELRREWETSLLRVVDFGQKPINSIKQEDVVKLLKRFWHTQPIKAERLLYRLAKVFQWAKVAGFRSGDNPANREEVRLRLGRPRIVKGHYASIDPEDAPAFYAKLEANKTPPARALQLIMLTACRADEIQLATWKEFSATKLTLPAERVKQRIQHEVPLSREARRVLKTLKNGQTQVFSFTSKKLTLTLLRKLTGGRETVHGLRSTFATWAEKRGYLDPIIERCLGHADMNKAREAYRRDPMLEERGALLEDWAAYLTGNDGNRDRVRRNGRHGQGKR
jgi:integrase